MTIRESGEMYLETIFLLSHEKPDVRSIDVAGKLGYRKSSVSVAMKNLRENDYIQMDADGYISLTDKGMKIAETMFERHTLISDCLVSLGVNRNIAVEDACRIEHIISAESFTAIKNYFSAELETTKN